MACVPVCIVCNQLVYIMHFFREIDLDFIFILSYALIHIMNVEVYGTAFILIQYIEYFLFFHFR